MDESNPNYYLTRMIDGILEGKEVDFELLAGLNGLLLVLETHRPFSDEARWYIVKKASDYNSRGLSAEAEEFEELALVVMLEKAGLVEQDEHRKYRLKDGGNIDNFLK